MTVAVWPETSGSIEIDGAAELAYPAVLTLAPNSKVVLEAKAADGYQFTNWSGALSGTENPVTTIISASMNVTAQFSLATRTLTVESSGSGSTTPGSGAYGYDHGSIIGLIAIPDKGWKFDSWSGQVADSSSSNTTVVVDADMTVAAKFSQIMHALTVNYDNSGKTASTLGPYQYAEGTTVNIVAASQRGWKFDSWSGDVADPNSATTTVLMDSDKSVTANFVRTGPSGPVIGIIGGAVGAGLAAFFTTRRKRIPNGIKDIVSEVTNE